MTVETLSSKINVCIDFDQCIDCSSCIKKCPRGVYQRESDKILIQSNKCTGCLRCIRICPRDAITISAESKRNNWKLSFKYWILSKLKH
ncbi:4Fe-4S dicluster domain-containing protein [Methanosarcina barkeri]|uniref:4Fe-4S dicluster domain-containing protein n=1 Tax=Methanosarcina barkeri TaxID=2208 RepID=UPI0009BBC718